MSREQRRVDRRAKQRAGGGAPRRTPVKAAGTRRIPWIPIGVAAGVLAVVLLVVFLIWQSSSGGGPGVSGADKAAADASSSIPGTFVPSQGRGHYGYSFSLARMPTPFCPDVIGPPPAGSATGTAAASPSPAATSTLGTAAPEATSRSGQTPQTTPTVATNCYSSNPPSSGRHLGVQRNVDVGNGALINIPPDPNVYPDDLQIPREAIPHILEHAGVFVGWSCESGNSACMDVVQKIKDVVNDRIDNNSNRVVMAHDTDLPEGVIGIVSWTRAYDFYYQDYNKDKFVQFIAKNSCRVDFEGFCK